jgi:hypothetical protein
MKEKEIMLLIDFWENKLQGMQAYLSPSENVLIKNTIKALKLLQPYCLVEK